jgi:hypothetical protein
MATIIAMRAAACGVTPDAPKQRAHASFHRHTLPATRLARQRFAFNDECGMMNDELKAAGFS